jgi:hypothetical protein
VCKFALAALALAGLTQAATAQTVSLTAAPTTAAMPDGQKVPMWGYSCGTGAAAPSGGASCAALNPNAGANWSPVIITVPYSSSGTSLTINLTNSLSFAVAGGGTNTVPTSLVVLGQLGGGLGAAPTRTPSPVHAPQGTTWPIAGAPDTGGATAGNPTFTPPAQPDRVQSFATEVAAGATTALTWSNLKPGTYLIESGTHPSIQVPMGLYGLLVVTTPPAGGAPGTAYGGVSYDAEVPLVMGEIDPLQNATVAAAVGTAGFSETRVWSGLSGQCGDPKSATYLTCYPPVVNYDPRYFLINGIAFDRTKPANSQFPVTAPASTGQILLRLANAGSRMHVPAVVGAQTVDSSSGAPLTVQGLALVAEDGNLLPGNRRIQNEVFMAAGKTTDAVILAPATGAGALPVFDRQLSLSTNNQRDGGMQAYISVNGGALPTSAIVNAAANPDTYYVVPGNTLIVAEVGKGVIANDVGVYGVQVQTPPAAGSLVLNSDGTFSYTPNSGTTSDSFTYCGNGATAGALCTTVTLAACTAGNGCLGGAPTARNDSYTSKVASRLQISPPGVLANDSDPTGLPLHASAATGVTGGTVTLNADGSFVVTPTTPPAAGSSANVTFQYSAVNSQNTSSAPATVTVTFNGGSGLAVAVKDAKTGLPITDYRWIIEEDRTFYVDPACQTTESTRPATCPPLPVPSIGTSFHTSYMPVVASGCVGTLSCESGQTAFDTASNSHLPAVCDIGNGACRTLTDPTLAQKAPVDPSQVALDPKKRYYISILPGDAANPFIAGSGAPVDTGRKDAQGNPILRPFSIDADCGPYSPSSANWTPGSGLCGHGMGGAPLAAGQTTVSVGLQQTPFQTAKVSVYVFEDDSPLNGEIDVGGGTDVFGTAKEPGLSGFFIRLFDDAGGTGDATGQITYDMFNMPISNSLAGMIDPRTGLDACPISKKNDGLVGVIITCPKYESDGVTLSPLVGQAIIGNLYPGRYGVVANPGADRIANGEEWLQTNTLDGQKAHDSFIKVGGPAYFQEFGPAGFHVAIGFANPKIINDRRTNAQKTGICDAVGASCLNSVSGRVTGLHIHRPPNESLYSSGSRDSLAFTQCYVSLGDTDGDDIAFTRCDADGNFSFSGLPDGTWRITIFDQWNDQIVDGLASAVQLPKLDTAGNIVSRSVALGDIPVLQWHTNLYTRSFIDSNKDGVSQDTEPGLALVATNIRFRDGSFSNFNNTDLNGFAGFNEVFPLFSWYVVEADTTRFKQTGVHVVYDAGGPVDCTSQPGNPNCSTIAGNLASTAESATAHLPGALRVPGAVYCNDADCTDRSGTNPSTGRIDPPWFFTEGWQGFAGQSSFIEFGKSPFADKENGGIRGHVVYASTRPFDDPQLLLQTSWEPLVPGVTINLYQVGTAADGSRTLKLVDTTVTSSWDAWAQGFRSDDPTSAYFNVPNMNCPGQEDGTKDPFFFTLSKSTMWLDPQQRAVASNSQFKCYDGMHNFNQVQPAPYDGMYQFPSVTSRDPATGRPTASNCTICVPNPDGTDRFYGGTPMLPAGKYVVEVIVPPGYELVKEEDKNILIGDNYIAPVSQQFAGLGNIFILPDQAAVNASFNRNNAQNPTTNLGAAPRHEGDTGSDESFWPCAGQLRVVPDYISLFPGSQEVAPFAGALRPLCDRKEVVLEDQSTVLAKFYVFSSTHVAAHFTGFMLDDFSSEFDPYSPQFGEKFAIPNVPISIKDFAGNEISRVYSDQWGLFNGLNYSTWEVNPPNPTGYAPTMMVACMNDPGPIPGPNGTMITDPSYNPQYSQFCYEIPFMPGQTQYMDTPVVPTSAFASGYNPPDCAYPDATPAVASVLGDTSGGGAGPWVNPIGTRTLTINALGDVQVPNHAYNGPGATIAPYNQKKITRHYGFGTQCTSPTVGNATCNTLSSVTIGGVNATITSWTDTRITVTVPLTLPLCPVQQSGQPAARCGELVITAGNGKKSIDAVTVTLGGKAPTYVAGESLQPNTFGDLQGNALQTAIDKAAPGDLIIVGPGTYTEMLQMWKPVRLQGVGAASVVINANTHPSGRLDPWRRRINCLFGIALNGVPISATNPYDPSNTYSCPANMRAQVDPIPFEPIIAWDYTLNGHLAELLIEPSILGAYEGSGILVLGKGKRLPAGALPGTGTEGDFPPGTVDLTASAADCRDFAGNYLCNPARIDGLTVTNSSQGGGGIFLHGWNHNTEVANNRVNANAGTLTGGIIVGQVEVPPGTITPDGLTQLPYGFNRNVNIHHNAVTNNSSYGDEINSTTPSSAGGATFCSGSDNYQFKYNWVCGNMSSGDGGGLAHFGFSYNGTIANNWVLFNQSNNPTLPTYGGGIVAMGVPPDGTFCENATVDQDCAPDRTEGAGPGLVIDGNLIIGNTAQSGKGGGLRLQLINGDDVDRNPNNPNNWFQVTVTNNIIANNVAGWAGGGVSLQDALRVNLINNTIISNDATASSGVLFNTDAATKANVGPPVCQPVPNSPDVKCNPITTSTPQPAGVEVARNTTNLTNVTLLNGTTPRVTCPAGRPSCATFSNPVLRNNIIWQNRTFFITVGGLNPGIAGLQNVVTLNPTLNQAGHPTGFCDPNAKYWEIGAYGDSGPSNHSSGLTLSPAYSILTDAADYPGANNLGLNPAVFSQYCNGSRAAPESTGNTASGAPIGIAVPPGIADSVLPNPLFTLLPTATPDEGNQWINMMYGPLSLTNATIRSGAGYNQPLGNYAIAENSPAINTGTASGAPNHDFFGNPRPMGGGVDIGAVEFLAAVAPPPPMPALGVLDNFNRANANNLNNGTNWQQLLVNLGTLGGPNNAGIRVNTNQAFCVNNGTLAQNVLCALGANAYWNGTVFGPRQAAAFTFAGTTLNGSSLLLKASGTYNTTLGYYPNAIRVRYSTAAGGQVIVETTGNGIAFASSGTLSGAFANGDTLTAFVDAVGSVYVWKTTAANVTTYLGLVSLPVDARWTSGGGRIGVALPSGARVDNFAGGNVP